MAGIAGAGMVARALETASAIGGVVLLRGLVIGRRLLLRASHLWVARPSRCEILLDALDALIFLVFRHGFPFRCGLLRTAAALSRPENFQGSPRLSCNAYAGAPSGPQQ